MTKYLVFYGYTSYPGRGFNDFSHTIESLDQWEEDLLEKVKAEREEQDWFQIIDVENNYCIEKEGWIKNTYDDNFNLTSTKIVKI